MLLFITCTEHAFVYHLHWSPLWDEYQHWPLKQALIVNHKVF